MARLTDAEVEQLGRIRHKQLVDALRRYQATGRVPEGVMLARAPTLPPNATFDERLEYTMHMKDVWRVLAERYLGPVGKTWDYEIILKDDGTTHINMDYVGDLDANVRDIKTAEVWTGGEE